MRAMWDESRLWMTRTQADNTVSRLVAGGFDTFIPCVWHGRGTTWPSATYTHRDIYWEIKYDPNFPDPLAYLIQKCHAEGIRVYPWFMISLNQFQNNEHPEFVDGPPDAVFNVHRPEFRTWIHDLMLEVVQKYCIDGLMLDYIRSNHGIAQYQQDDYLVQTGRVLLDDWAVKYSDPVAFDSIVQWRRNAIEIIVQNIYTATKAVRDIPVMAYGNPGSSDVWLQGQDLVKWANEGLVDAIWDGSSPGDFDTPDIVYAMTNMVDTSKYFMVAGNWIASESRPATGDELTSLIEYGQGFPKSQGIGVYLMNQYTDEQIVALRAGPFRGSS